MGDKMREEFEAWAKEIPMANLARHLEGYENQQINSYWSVWQASRQAIKVRLPSEDEYAYPVKAEDILSALAREGVSY